MKKNENHANSKPAAALDFLSMVLVGSNGGESGVVMAVMVVVVVLMVSVAFPIVIDDEKEGKNYEKSGTLESSHPFIPFLSFTSSLFLPS